MTHPPSFSLDAIAGHLAVLGVDPREAIVSLPEIAWLKLASRISGEIGQFFETNTVGGKRTRRREFIWHGIRYRSTG